MISGFQITTWNLNFGAMQGILYLYYYICAHQIAEPKLEQSDHNFALIKIFHQINVYLSLRNGHPNTQIMPLSSCTDNIALESPLIMNTYR